MRVTFLGDIMVSADQLASYKVNEKYNFDAAFAFAGKEFQASDLIIANLETPIAGEKMLYSHKQYSFNSPVELLYALKKAGISMVSTANNHCLDRKEEGLRRTIFHLKTCGMENLGTHEKKENSFIIKEIDGIKVGILSFTYGTNAFANRNYLIKENRFMVDLLQKQELSNPLIRMIWLSPNYITRIVKTIARKLHIGQFDRPVYERKESSKKEIQYYRDTIAKCRKAGAEYVIAYLHIGGQYNLHPTDYTKEICERSREWGVNAVIANHEHVIHEIDWEHISKTSFCIYSLGNFLSSTGVTEKPYDKRAQYSAAVNLDLERQPDGKVGAEYSLEIFCNRLDEKKRIISEPLVDYINQCGNSKLKQELLNDYYFLMNRIYNTEKVYYPLQKSVKLIAAKDESK